MMWKYLKNKFLSWWKPKSKYSSLDIFKFCVENIGKNFCLNYTYGGPETINKIFAIVTGAPITTENSTSQIYWMLQNNTDRFEKRNYPVPGDVIVSPTSYGTDKNSIGNIGIIDSTGKVFSNDPANGTLISSISVDEWKSYYDSLGIPTSFFTLK